MNVLALNCGSSSLKFGLYACDNGEPNLLYEGEAEEIGRPESAFWFKSAEKQEKREERIALPDHAAALAHSLDTLDQAAAPQPEAIGHRFVHGGPRIRQHQRVTAAVIDELRKATAYAPLHLPPALDVLDAIQKKLPGTPQVACLDTAFHSTMADVAKNFALPEDVRQLGVERYGFHGLSVESIIAQLQPAPDRLIVAHLGNGCSITAVQKAQSIDNTMGLTPAGGVMMGTRCGDLDPGAVIYLMRQGYADAGKLEDVFDHRSGLLGVSGKTSDVRELLKARKQNSRADLALRMFGYQIRKAIGAMAAALGGLDALVFTGGIGEHATELREEIRGKLEFLGPFQSLVLPAQEDLQIARITAQSAL